MSGLRIKKRKILLEIKLAEAIEELIDNCKRKDNEMKV